MQVTLTGITNGFDEAERLSKRYPFVEWGLLYSPAKEGAKRYPSRDQITEFAYQYPEVPKALHLCGKGATLLLDGDEKTKQLVSLFERVQINVNARRLSAQHLDGLYSYIQQSFHGRAFLPQSVITQHNKANEEILQSPAVQGLQNHHILVDSSGGRGSAPNQWVVPDTDDKPVGLAGGLNPQDLYQQILDMPQGIDWIDMESKLRDSNDEFDYQLAELALQNAQAAIFKEGN